MIGLEKESIVKALNVSKIYESGNNRVVALDTVSLEIYKGEILIILGPSGSGKTTLLNLLSGLDNPTNGTIEVLGQDLTKMNEEQKTKFRAKHIGFIFQFFNLVPVLTATENVELPLLINKVDSKVARDTALKLLNRLGILHRKDAFPNQLSGGEQQRVAIARALSIKPEIIWADEPTGALDSKSGENIKNLIVELNREYNTTVVIVTHDLSMMEIAHRTVRMDSGKIIQII